MSASTRTDVDGRVFCVGLDRPDKMNAFDLDMLRGLAEAYTRFEADPELWVMLVYATGPNFTAGLDLAEVGPAVERGDRLFPEDGVDPLDLFGARRTKPVVMAARGWCLTIGIELMLAADVRVAADDTKFGQIEVKRGIMPFGGATLRFPALTGWGNAMRYLLTGDTFDAAEAHRIGLVQDVHPADEVFDRARALAQRIAAQAPLAVRATRQSAQVAVEQGAAAARDQLMAPARDLMRTDDAREGVASFLERRDARFSGS